MFTGDGIGQREGVARIGKHIVGISSIHVKTGKPRIWAKIFLAALAKFTPPAGRIQPGDAGSIPYSKVFHTLASFIHNPDNLMSGDARQDRGMNIAFDGVEVGMADAAHLHAEPDHPWWRVGRFPFCEGEGMVFSRLLAGQFKGTHSYFRFYRLRYGPHIVITYSSRISALSFPDEVVH
jgi:hypothetical protein